MLQGVKKNKNNVVWQTLLDALKRLLVKGIVRPCCIVGRGIQQSLKITECSDHSQQHITTNGTAAFMKQMSLQEKFKRCLLFGENDVENRFVL